MPLTRPREPEILAPSPDCRLCPRLGAFRDGNRAQYPDFHNAPVPSFGGHDARLLIVGLAPGVKGANQTGRPFTGDYAGDLLYATLTKFGFAEGSYETVNSRIQPGGSEMMLEAAIRLLKELAEEAG